METGRGRGGGICKCKCVLMEMETGRGRTWRLRLGLGLALAPGLLGLLWGWGRCRHDLLLLHPHGRLELCLGQRLHCRRAGRGQGLRLGCGFGYMLHHRDGVRDRRRGPCLHQHGIVVCEPQARRLGTGHLVVQDHRNAGAPGEGARGQGVRAGRAPLQGGGGSAKDSGGAEGTMQGDSTAHAHLKYSFTSHVLDHWSGHNDTTTWCTRRRGGPGDACMPTLPGPSITPPLPISSNTARKNTRPVMAGSPCRSFSHSSWDAHAQGHAPNPHTQQQECLCEGPADPRHATPPGH
jgi:hypothetical protein